MRTAPRTKDRGDRAGWLPTRLCPWPWPRGPSRPHREGKGESADQRVGGQTWSWGHCGLPAQGLFWKKAPAPGHFPAPLSLASSRAYFSGCEAQQCGHLQSSMGDKAMGRAAGPEPGLPEARHATATGCMGGGRWGQDRLPAARRPAPGGPGRVQEDGLPLCCPRCSELP